jgi:RNA polymerase sigma-70 factor (ECF subfamily)
MEKGENIFTNLIEANKDKIYRICCYYVADEEDRKDLYQETLLNIWKGYKSFRGEAAFSTWVFRITVNTALLFLNKKRSIQQKAALFIESVENEENETYRNHEEINLLHKGINQLPLLDMIIISLVLEEVSSKEIALITGLTEPNVRVRVHRAKAKLKELLKGGE